MFFSRGETDKRVRCPDKQVHPIKLGAFLPGSASNGIDCRNAAKGLPLHGLTTGWSTALKDPAFVDNFVKYYTGWWADAEAAPLPGWDIQTSHLIVDKR